MRLPRFCMRCRTGDGGAAMRKSKIALATRRWMVVTCLLLITVIIYWYLNRRGLRWYSQWPAKMDLKLSKLECQRPQKELDSMADLAHRTYRTFDKLSITSFLTYGTLFGALRYRGPVPWDLDVDMGVVGATIDRYSLSQLREAFRKEGVTIHYEQYGGLYKLRRDGMSVDIFPYYNTYGGEWMYRHGLESYIFFVNYRYHHRFPKSLLKEPLPKIEFGGVMMNMTRGRYKLQSYLFRDDWSIEVRPPGCESVQVEGRRDPVIVTYAPEDPDNYA
eukprot:scpid28294/ scgid35494/ 